MTEEKPMGAIEAEKSRLRRITAMGLLEIEDKPLSPEDIEMFEMFERERWPHSKRLEHIKSMFKKDK